MSLIKNTNYFALACFFFFVCANGIMRGKISAYDFFRLKEKRNIYQKKIEELSKENTRLETEIARIEHSKEYAKKVLKDKYHMLEEKEKILFFSQESENNEKK